LGSSSNVTLRNYHTSRVDIKVANSTLVDSTSFTLWERQGRKRPTTMLI